VDAIEGPFTENHDPATLARTARWSEYAHYPQTAKNSKNPIRRDVMVCWTHILRRVRAFRPNVIFAHGQPAIILAGLSLRCLESIFRYRAVDLQEGMELARAWLAVQAYVVKNPHWSTKPPAWKQLPEFIPEILAPHDRTGPPIYQVAATDAERKAEGKWPHIEYLAGKILIVATLLAKRVPSEYYEHSGLRSCGRRTWTFATCDT